MPYLPREERDRARMLAATLAAQAGNAAALDMALAQIGTAFGEAAVVNAFKLRVERMIRLGPGHRETQARFGGRAALLSGHDLNAAIVRAERWWRDERKAFQIASALGYGNRLSLDVLCELRLMLRLMRFKKMQTEFGVIVGAMSDEASALAAE
jgi:hypothetical protein